MRVIGVLHLAGSGVGDVFEFRVGRALPEVSCGSRTARGWISPWPRTGSGSPIRLPGELLRRLPEKCHAPRSTSPTQLATPPNSTSVGQSSPIATAVGEAQVQATRHHLPSLRNRACRSISSTHHEKRPQQLRTPSTWYPGVGRCKCLAELVCMLFTITRILTLPASAVLSLPQSRVRALVVA